MMKRLPEPVISAHQRQADSTYSMNLRYCMKSLLSTIRSLIVL